MGPLKTAIVGLGYTETDADSLIKEFCSLNVLAIYRKIIEEKKIASNLNDPGFVVHSLPKDEVILIAKEITRQNFNKFFQSITKNVDNIKRENFYQTVNGFEALGK